MHNNLPNQQCKALRAGSAARINRVLSGILLPKVCKDSFGK